MSDSYIQVPPDSTGKKIDTIQTTTPAGTVERQVVQERIYPLAHPDNTWQWLTGYADENGNGIVAATPPEGYHYEIHVIRQLTLSAGNTAVSILDSDSNTLFEVLNQVAGERVFIFPHPIRVPNGKGISVDNSNPANTAIYSVGCYTCPD